MVVAGTHSGVGKTTVATGLMAAFTRRGVRVGAAKVGPDYIDPGYHALATGRPSRNLDPWMCGERVVPGLAARAGGELLIVEGVMGLFDGSGERDPATASSTAHVARLLAAPVVLVVDAGAMSGSVAALVHGFASFDPSVRVAGVILNRVGSDSHQAMLEAAIAPLAIPVLGVLRRDPGLTWRDRHLGLVPVVEQREQIGRALERLADRVGAGCDLAGIEALARSAQALRPDAPPAPTPVGHVRVAVAAGPAFSFCYPDNLEALAAAGAELVPFDPLSAETLPDAVDGIVAGGGFPEVYAPHLAANRPLLDDVRARVAGGLVTWAECGGLLWLGRTLDGRPMAGAVPCDARMTDHLTLGYRRGRTRVTSPLGPAGAELRGHEFHYSTVDPPGDGLATDGRAGANDGGYLGPTLAASYLHLHLGAAPAVAEAFVRACADATRRIASEGIRTRSRE